MSVDLILNSLQTSHKSSKMIKLPGGDQDSSPLKLFPKLVKRSTSVDVSANQSLSSSPPSDPWRFFSDIKGKITKSVEEKITEIKSRHEEGSPLHKSKSEPKREANKDSSSFSDSEDQSESSISKTCGCASTTEGVEMSSDDETSSIDKEKKPSSPGIIRQRFRFLKHQKSGAKEGSVNVKNISRLYSINTDKIEQALPEPADEVESAVDALEETDFKKDNMVKEEDVIARLAEKIDNFDLDDDNVLNVKQVSGEDVQKSFFSGDKRMSTVFAPTGFIDLRFTRRARERDANILPYILLSIYIVVYAIFHTYLPYMAGLLLGASLALIFGFIYVKLYTMPVSGDNTDKDVLTSKITKIPAIKEHQPLIKYEGWVNEYPDTYDPIVYHISQTQSVFLRLQGNLLRISHSKTKVPKRAMYNEPDIKASFTHHRIYNMMGAKVSLLPEGLAKIRLWSKKYPICVTLSKDQMNFDPSVVEEEPTTIDGTSKEKSGGKTEKSPKNKKKFLFKKKDTYFIPQQYSKILDDQDIDLDSDSRASTPSPEDVILEKPVLASDDKKVDDDEEEEMHSLPEDSPEDSQKEINIFLFGRTDREKEDWFRRLASAAHYSSDSSQEDATTTLLTDMRKTELEYIKYMTLFTRTSRKSSKQEKDGESIVEDVEEPRLDMQLWLNALIGRVLFDCMRDPSFTKKVQNRIQKKLQTIKLPYFIEEILITELNLGKTPPLILNAGRPFVDGRGLWVDLDISYEGAVVVTLQTKLNLMKLKNPQLNDKTASEIKSAIFHSDVDDSAESSSDEDGPQEIPVTKEGAERSAPTGSKKFIKMVDRIAESKFFQAATDNRYIKKAMEGVSNTELRLTVELKALSGTVVLNVPPPPSDRVWVGFRPVPELLLTARPIVGDRNVTYTMVTSWIEKKIMQEFQKVMVVPNMEDFLVSVMDSTLPE